MAVVSVSVTDTGDNVTLWKIPPGVQDDNFVPRAIRTYRGTTPIAAKLAADVTNVRVTFTFPTPYVYLLKTYSFRFSSDDTVNDFNNVGTVRNFIYGLSAAEDWQTGQVKSEGSSLVNGTLAYKTWQLTPQFPRVFMVGQDSMQMDTTLVDESTDASTAGDVSWFCEFFEFDHEQFHTWPVHSAQPVFCY